MLEPEVEKLDANLITDPLLLRNMDIFHYGFIRLLKCFYDGTLFYWMLFYASNNSNLKAVIKTTKRLQYSRKHFTSVHVEMKLVSTSVKHSSKMYVNSECSPRDSHFTAPHVWFYDRKKANG